jgi:uncharacterized membrane protein
LNIEILDRLPLEILIHLFTALAAFFLGAYQLFRKKGTKHHKQIGWAWFALMTVTAISAIFIRGFEGSSMPTLFGFSPIHLFVILTLYSVPKAIIEIRRGDVKAHARSVKGLYMGGMVIAGLFTFMPGRTMWHIFFGG